MGRLHLFMRMIREPNERPRFDVAEAPIHSFLLQLGELIRMIIFGDIQMLRRRLQILSQRQNIAINCPQVIHGL